MGSGSFDACAYRAFASSAASKTTDEIYTSASLDASLNPKGVKVRESRDSADNPNSTPIIVAIDVTGSMGIIADVLARQGLGTLFQEILDRKPITDPHLMFMAIGDANHDRAPLQVSQFEADNRIVEQLTKIFLEKGGGGNCFESYNLAHYFAANHTEHDSYVKRAKRGYLFTVGDEDVPAALTQDQIKTFVGDTVQADVSAEESLQDAERTYDVFHIIVEEGDYARRALDRVVSGWTRLMGQSAIRMPDHEKLSETIVSIIEAREGLATAKTASRFGTTVFSSVKHLAPSRTAKPLMIAQ